MNHKLPKTNNNFQFILLALFCFCVTSLFAQTKADYTMSYNSGADTYTVSVETDATGQAFTFFYLGILVPSSTVDGPITYTPLVSGLNFGDNSQVNAPGADPTSDFHSASSSLFNFPFVANTKQDLFTFSLGTGSCSSGVRLFINSSDPQPGDSGMAGGDFNNSISYNFSEIYDENFLAPTTVCSSASAPGGISADLALWLKADVDATAAQWDDQSGNSNDAVQATAGNQPSINANSINFNPAANFDGVDDNMSRILSSEIITNNSVYIVASTTGSGAESVFSSRFSVSGGDNPGERSFQIDRGGTGNTYRFNQQPDVGYGSGADGVPIIVTNTIAGALGATSSSTTYSNGSLGNTGTQEVDGGRLFTDYLLGTNRTKSSFIEGDISEVIVYNEAHTTASTRQRIESYLSIKYGITLDQSASGGGTSYLASDGSTIWAEDINDNHEFHIFGIGRDDASGLGQVKSKSVNSKAVVTIEAEGEGTNAVNAFTDIADKEFLMIGNDDDGFIGGENWYIGTGGTYDSYAMLERVWRSQQVGSVGTIQIDIDVNDPDFNIAAPLDGGAYYFIQDTDGDTDFEDETPVIMTDQGGGIWRISGVTFGSNDKFTFGSALPPAPAGISTDLTLWLKADAGTGGGGTVGLWEDQSISGFNAGIGFGVPPLNLLENQRNFNPAIEFNLSRNLGSSLNSISTSGSGTLFIAFTANGGGQVFGLTDTSLSGSSIFDQPFVSQNSLSTDSDGFQNFNTPNENHHILRVEGDSTGDTISSFQNGSIDNSSAFTGTMGNSGYIIGDDRNIGGDNPGFAGDISEVIFYDHVLSVNESQQVESYLALKYGLTLDQATATDYISSGVTPTISWDSSVDAAYNSDIFGIGRDDRADLNQKVSKSVNTNTVFTVSMDADDFTKSNTDVVNGHTNDLQFLSFANNGLATDDQITELDTNSYNLGISREWQVYSTANFTDAVNLKFEGFAGYDVIQSVDSDFSTDADQTVLGTLDNNGELTNITGLVSGSYLSLAIYQEAPGGVTSNLALWLKSDAGTYNNDVSVTTPGSPIDAWRDQSGNGNDALNAGTSDVVLDNYEDLLSTTGVARSMNYNPVIYFDELGDKLVGTNLGMDGDNTMTEFFALHDDGPTEERVEIFSYAETDRTAHRIEVTDGAGLLQIYDDAYTNDLTFPTNALNQASPTIISSSHDGTEINGYYLGTLGGTQTTTTGITANGNYGIGDLDGTEINKTGFGEAIIYNETLSASDRQKVTSYLAIKYGMTLNNGETNYIASDGTAFWTIDTTYKNRIYGIGRDDAQGLHQRISSPESNYLITVSVDNNFVDANTTHTSALTDKQFLMVASNSASYQAQQDTELASSTNFNLRLSREWKVNNIGGVGEVNLQFEEYDDTWSLITTNDGDFSTGIITTTQLSATGAVAVTLANNETFTLAKYQKAPGGVTADIVLWLKADVGTNSVVNGDPISQWDNQIPSAATEVEQATAGSQPLYYSNSEFNFNPAIDFDGADDELYNTLDDDALFPSYSADETNVFVVTSFDKGLAEANGPLFGFVNEDFSGYESWYADYPSNGNITYQVGIPASGGAETSGATPANIGVNTPSIAGFVHSVVDDKIQILVNGSELSATSAGQSGLVGNGIVRIGTAERDGNLTQEFYDGKIVEVIAYDANLSDTKKQQIQSYLALKYGITLGVYGSEPDYIASDGSFMWSYTKSAESVNLSNDPNFPLFVDVPYSVNITGLGRDDTSGLDQRVSKSVHSDAVLSIALDADFSAANNDASRTTTHTNDLQFISFGHNGGDANQQVTELDPTSDFNVRLTREWKIQRTNMTQDVNLQFEGHDGWSLIKVASGNDFSSNLITIGVLDTNGEITVTAADLPDTTVFTLAKYVEAPGGVKGSLALWLKSNVDATTALWEDQSGNDNDASQSTTANQPFHDFDQLNNHPVYEFQGTGPVAQRDGFDIPTLELGNSASIFIVSSNFIQNTETISSLRPILMGNADYSGGQSYNGYAIGKQLGDTDVFASGPDNNPSADRLIGPLGLTRQPDMLSFLNDDGAASLFVDGLTSGTTTYTETGGDFITGYSIGYDPSASTTALQNARHFFGQVTEIIAYDRVLTPTERLHVESYLALKYGIGLLAPLTDYYDSDGNSVFDLTAGYATDVIGLGRDDASALHQRVSSSANLTDGTRTDLSLPILSVATDNLFAFQGANDDASRTDLDDDKDYLMIGHNGNDIAFETSDVNLSTYIHKLEREWRIENTGDVGEVWLKFIDDSGSTDFDDSYVLLTTTTVVGGDADFSNATSAGALSSNGRVSATLTDGMYFTLAKIRNPKLIYNDAYNITAAEYDGATAEFSIAAQETATEDFTFNDDGTKMFVIGANARVYEYNLATAYEVATATYAGSTEDFAIAQDATPTGIIFNASGTQMYILGDTNNSVFEYNLATAFDVSTATYAAGEDLDLASLHGNIPYSGFSFSADGTQLYVSSPDYEFGDEDIIFIDLNTPYDISSFEASTTDIASLYGFSNNYSAILISTDGTKMFVLKEANDAIDSYDLEPAFDIESRSNAQTFSIASEETEATGMYFNADGTKLFIIGATGDISSYNFDAADYTEVAANDGEVENTDPLIIKLMDDEFTGAIGSDLVADAKVIIGNVPSGLSPVLTKDSNAQVTLTFTGKADPNGETEDVTDLTFVFADVAFTNSAAAAVMNSGNAGAYSSTVGVDFLSNLITNTIITATSPIEANGTATSTITIQLVDENGNYLTVSGGTVALSTSGSAVLSTVTDNGDGTYSATAINLIEETVTISGTIDSSNIIQDTADIIFENNAPTPIIDPVASIVTATSPIEANGSATSTITVQLYDTDGNVITTGGATVTLATTGDAEVTAVTDNGDGTYTATAVNSTVETVILSAKVNGTEILDTADVIFMTNAPEPVIDPVASIIQATSPVQANGTDSATIILQLYDTEGNLITSGGATVTFATTGDAVLSAVTDNGDGTYTATVSNSIVETVLINATVNGTEILDTAEVVFQLEPPTAIIVDGTDSQLVAIDALGFVNNSANPGTVQITLIAIDGNPIEGALVSLTDDDDNATLSYASAPTGFTDVNGQFTVDVNDSEVEIINFTAMVDADGQNGVDLAIPLGDPHAVRFVNGSIDTSNPLTKIEATDNEGYITVPDSGEIRVTLIDEDGNTAENIAVMFITDDNDAEINMPEGFTDSNGQYTSTVSNTELGVTSFSVFFDSNGDGIVDTDDTLVPNGDTADVNFTIDPNGDDDGDGISNKDEDTDDDGDPTNDDCDEDGKPNYLDADPCGQVGSISTLKAAEGFTPNGDGINDKWVIQGIENYPNSIIKVYNRWGHEVFDAQGYQNDWIGFYQDRSRKLPPGSYYYIIDLGEGTQIIDGWFFLNYQEE